MLKVQPFCFKCPVSYQSQFEFQNFHKNKIKVIDDFNVSDYNKNKLGKNFPKIFSDRVF